MTPEQRLIPPPSNQRFGLGDVVKKAATPVVWAIKAAGGPNLSGCGSCRARQEKLNKMIPNVLNPLNR
jgi:hypothetical protein